MSYNYYVHVHVHVHVHVPCTISERVWYYAPYLAFLCWLAVCSLRDVTIAIYVTSFDMVCGSVSYKAHACALLGCVSRLFQYE